MQRMSGSTKADAAAPAPHTMPTAVVATVAALLSAGAGEALGEARFLPLVTLDSGARCGLDAAGRWVLVPDDGRPAVAFDPADAHLFHEVLEWKRARFDDALEAGARAAGIPHDDVVLGFPAVPIVRAVLAKEHAYLTRLALEWIAPTELRELRDAIRAAGRGPNMPLAVRQLAERLTVPE
jgi:hypothetical protein